MTKQVLTANDLRSGGVVFLTPKGDWSPYIAMASVSDNCCSAEQLEAQGQRSVADQLIVGPFLIDVNTESGVPSPVRFREQLRVNGPSVIAEFRKPVFSEVA